MEQETEMIVIELHFSSSSILPVGMNRAGPFASAAVAPLPFAHGFFGGKLQIYFGPSQIAAECE